MIKNGIRVVIARLGMDAHWRGSIVVARALRNMNNTMVILGGTIPPDDIPKLKQAGIAEVFGPGTSLKKIVDFVSGSN
ncbi:MAG: hypothetical protein B1H13_08935 [Desulfobacteraceae bacterium 4484_190.3]|nr:MAG: hypothetical protein B1H13_08935 [Desulfobacteraceae bacterium 4484_190.3]